MGPEQRKEYEAAINEAHQRLAEQQAQAGAPDRYEPLPGSMVSL